MRRSTHAGQAGFSLLEMILVISILGFLARALVESSRGMGQLSSSGSTQALLQEQGDKAQRSILNDLRRTGIRDLNGRRYPFVFAGSNPGSGFPEHVYTPGTQSSSAGDADFGQPHAIIFAGPSDLDGDNRPDFDLDRNGIPELDGNGDQVRSESSADLGSSWDPTKNTIDPQTGLVWSHDEISYLVVTGSDGRNRLERRVGADANSAKTIALDVERLDIETAEDTGYQIPTNALRVKVFFRRNDSAGVLYRYRTEFVVSLRNGDLSL